jgi:endonuclease-3
MNSSETRVVLQKETIVADEQDALRVKALEIYKRLTRHYGERALVPRREPLQELIMTMLSQRTTWQNEALAFQRMWGHYGSWEAIRDADINELTALIAPSNYAEVKAPHIKAILARIIQEQGAPTIDFLAALPTEEGLNWLLSLPGVGIKTASLVLLFCFSKPIMPVDTHVHRVSQRTGLIDVKVTPEKAHNLLLDMLPNDPYWLYNFHVSAMKHGQQLCKWSNPVCERCPLTALCDYYQSLLSPNVP